MIDVQNLTVQYHTRRLFQSRIDTVLADVSFSVNPGEVVVVLGPNGAGKTTLLRALCNMLPWTGQISYEGVSANGKKPHELPTWIVKGGSLYTHFSVAKNIVYTLQLRGFPKQECTKRLAAAAERLGIQHLMDRPASQLSSGETQRIIIARMMVVMQEKPVLFLDEALAHVDPMGAERFRSLFLELFREYGSTVLYVTHDRRDALETCGVDGRMLFLHDGTIAQYGTARELITHPANHVVRRHLSDWYDSELRFYTGLQKQIAEGGSNE